MKSLIINSLNFPNNFNSRWLLLVEGHLLLVCFLDHFIYADAIGSGVVFLFKVLAFMSLTFISFHSFSVNRQTVKEFKFGQNFHNEVHLTLFVQVYVETLKRRHGGKSMHCVFEVVQVYVADV
jgi:hypothetical protein